MGRKARGSEEEQVERTGRMKLLSGVLGGILLAGAAWWPGPTQAAGTDDLKLRVGDAAPDFKLQYFDGKELKDVTLNDYRGKKNVVLAFYVFAFNGG